ncbi:hypothetical protein JCM11251_003379 [Rhodosporidiobolus azoricus]
MPALPFTVSTVHGPVTGYFDTHPLRPTTSAKEHQNGGRQPVNKWLGIPYAQAKRFERPTAPEKWEEARECFEFGSMFPQPPSNTEVLLSKLPGFILREGFGVSEDSHFVNVFAPGDVQEGEKLPVLVWIYGGALNNGSSEKAYYDPTEWIRSGMKDGQRCIVVTGNYRTNIFGFLSHPDVAAADPDGLCGNYGLYDCVAMLEWVQTNIHSFGGDPSNVTAFGQSAGAFIVSHLLVSGKKLFQKAVCQSGAVGTMMLRPPSKAYPAYSTILSSLPSGPSPSAPPSERFSALRSAPTSALLAAHCASHSFNALSLTLEPHADGKGIWTEDTLERLRRGEWDPWVESVVLGTTEDEGSAFAWGMKLNHPQAFDAYLTQFPSSVQPLIREKYLSPFPGGTHPPADQLDFVTAPGSRLLTDQVFVNPVWDQAVALAGAGGGARAGEEGEGRKGVKTYLYKLRTGVETLLKFSPIKLGIMHSMDLPLLFSTSSLWAYDESSSDAKTARAMGSRWMRFAATGDPDPEWKPFTPSSPSHLVFSYAGETTNESLEEFERQKLELHMDDTDKDKDTREGEEGAGEEVLGRTNE